jgi:predicted lipoprotein with Yx(FWY)xxD motif
MAFTLHRFWSACVRRLGSAAGAGSRTVIATLLLWPAVSAAEPAAATIYWQPADSSDQEAYIEELTPPGIRVVSTALEGPVYADERGHTLYSWPLGALRNGSTGDRKDGPSNCTDEVLRVSAGLMSPYPPDLLLPDADNRMSCADAWPPLLAAEDAEAVGKWTLVERADGARQWAYDGYPLYTSHLDKKAGDALGGSKLRSVRDGGIVRVPVGPPPDVPADFKVIPTTTGRLLVNNEEFSVYTWDGDEPNKSNCKGACLEAWEPVPAPEIAVDRGEWTIVRHDSGFRQWAYRGRPLYTHRNDPGSNSFVGSDVPDWRNPQWHNVYTQRAVTPPAQFTVQDVEFGGQVLANSEGRTIYLYNCRDDSLAQLACDHPDAPQDYRLAICGNGDAKVCRETFPYVLAEPTAVSDSPLWSVVSIDPDTGHHAAAGDEGALHVWAYRARPVYTYVGDREPGVTNGDGIGEFTGRRNGYKAFVLRDDFGENAFRR